MSGSPVVHRWAVLSCGVRALRRRVGSVRVDWMLQQIDQRRVDLEGQADGLRKQLAEIEEELVELAAAARWSAGFYSTLRPARRTAPRRLRRLRG